jgi:hypothetical protein
MGGSPVATAIGHATGVGVSSVGVRATVFGGAEGTADVTGPEGTADVAGPEGTADVAGPEGTADVTGRRGEAGASFEPVQPHATATDKVTSAAVRTARSNHVRLRRARDSVSTEHGKQACFSTLPFELAYDEPLNPRGAVRRRAARRAPRAAIAARPDRRARPRAGAPLRR